MRRVLALLATATALATPALAQPLRSGPAAYGNWQADAPGVTRLIRPQDMPAPHATPAATARSTVVPRPANAMPKVPPGFAIALVADGLKMPRSLRTAPNGDVFLAESGAGQIRILRLRPDGRADSTVFASGLDRPYGIAFWPPQAPRYVYVGETNRLVRFPWTPGNLHASGAPEVIIPVLPTGGHWTRDLAVSPDGNTLFVAVGSGTNIAGDMEAAPPGGVAAWQAGHALGATWGKEQGRANVLAFTPDGKTDQVYATGLRNCSGITIDPATTAIWCAVNERDLLGDDLPPDYATHVQPGAFYGWPWFYIGDHPDNRVAPRPDLASRITLPDVLIQPHSAPLGITFYTGTQFPAEYRGNAFVALHGSWDRANRTGYKVVRLLFSNGRPTGEYQDFVTGFVVNTNDVWGRPVGVTTAPDGSLLVSEDGNGTIWRVSAKR